MPALELFEPWLGRTERISFCSLSMSVWPDVDGGVGIVSSSWLAPPIRRFLDVRFLRLSRRFHTDPRVLRTDFSLRLERPARSTFLGMRRTVFERCPFAIALELYRYSICSTS